MAQTVQKSFFCRVLVLLRKNIVFLEFPHHLNVLNQSPILHQRGELTKNQINAPIKYYYHLPIALVVFCAMPRVQLLNRRGGILYSHPTELVVGRSTFAIALVVLIALLTAQVFARILFAERAVRMVCRTTLAGYFPGHLIRQGGQCVENATYYRCWWFHVVVVLCIYVRWVL